MHQAKKTKIVCTIGPATESEEKLAELLKAGMNVMRLNFSHGDFAEHQRKVDNLAKAVKKTGIDAAVMQDLSGPKFRIGDFKTPTVMLKEGEYITLTPEDIIGDEKRVHINYPTLAKEIKVGRFVMVDDGKKKFEVTEIKGNDIVCRIIVGGETKGRRGVNLPGANLKIGSLTDKDKADVEFGIKNNVDIVAFSFVRRAEDVIELRDILERAESKAMVLSKIETHEAIENFDSILELSDAVMVARGDLAVEIGAENVPSAQKMIIHKANEAGKPVITATQMLESMINSPVPTRAEVSDVANAILDGTDAIMLSEETTLGKFPVEAVKVMTRVAIKMESEEIFREVMENRKNIRRYTDDAADAITSEAVDVAEALNATCIAALTHTGFTAQMIARFKPTQLLMAFTPDETSYRQLLLSFGVMPVLNKRFKTLTAAVDQIKSLALKNEFGKAGDKIVIAGGFPFEHQKDTNMLLVETL